MNSFINLFHLIFNTHHLSRFLFHFEDDFFFTPVVLSSSGVSQQSQHKTNVETLWVKEWNKKFQDVDPFFFLTLVSHTFRGPRLIENFEFQHLGEVKENNKKNVLDTENVWVHWTWLLGGREEMHIKNNFIIPKNDDESIFFIARLESHNYYFYFL